MANFEEAYSHTMIIEGGYVNHKYDTGKETYKGISRKNNPKWGGWAIIDKIKDKTGIDESSINISAAANSELQSCVRNLYKTNYWDVNRLGEIRYQSIANELFDSGVNMGVGIAASFLQEALNLCNKNGNSYKDISVDGKIGAVTLEIINNRANERVVYNTLNLLQGERYLKIMRANKSQEVFWAGWLKRILLK